MFGKPVQHRSKLICAAGVDRDKAGRLLWRLESLTGAPLHLRVNRNASTLLSLTKPRDGSPPRFSVHKMFLAAPDEVVNALAQYIKRSTPTTQAVLRTYMDTNAEAHEQEQVQSRPMVLRTRGRVHDLHALADDENRE